nr:phage tail protein [uncultured Mediterranean phage uvMED]
MYNWLDKLLIKLAKRILNRYAPKGEFIAYINKQEEEYLKKIGGYGKPINDTGIKSFFGGFSGFVGGIVNIATKVFGKKINPFVALAVTLAISWLFRPKVPEQPDFGVTDFDNFEKGLLVNKQSNDATIPVVYGERLIGGTRVFVETSGTDNTYLYICLVLAEGEINDITEIRVDDKAVTWASDLADNTAVEVNTSDSNFYKDSESLIRVEPHYGSDGQSASTLLSTLSSWGSNHKLSGLAYLAIRFKWNQDVFAGVPKIQAKVQGKKVVAYNSSLVAQTASYSTNPAWCLLDYLTNARYGKGLATSEINLQSFYDASQVAVTQVTPYSGGSDINIFDTNTAVDTSASIIANVREFLKGCRGYLPYSAGKYQLIIEKTGSASITLTEDSIVGGYNLVSPDKNSKFNRVICSFVNPDRNFQIDEVQFPPIDDSGLPSADRHATMKTADGGFLLEGRFDFKTITSKYQAEEMAEIILRRSRDALSLSINVAFNSYDLAIGDIVNITHSSLGFSAKPFRVLSMTFNEDFTVGLGLVEHQDAHYTWATKTQSTAVPSTTLPNPFTVQPPASVTLTDQLIQYNETPLTALDIEIGVSPDSFVDYYQVEYKLSTDSDFIIHSQGSGLFQRVLNVIDDSTYDVRVKAVSSFGSSSSYVTAQRKIIGAIAPPSDVEDLSCNISGQEAHLGWTAIPDLDLSHYNLRYSTETNGSADWQNSVSLVEKISRPATSISVPARVGTYLIKAVDKLGNFSSNATAVISNVTSTLNFNAVTTQSEHPTFAGTKTNIIETDDTLKLDSSELFDSASGNFDSGTGLFDSGVQPADLYASGSYDFANVIDIGAKHTIRVTASITQTSDNLDDVFDSRSGNFDDQPSNFDGDTPANCNAHLEIATSDDNSTYTSFQNFVIGDYTARYLKFKLVMTSSDLSSTPVVSALTVTVDMPDRIFSGNDLTSGAGTYSLTFTNPFKSVNYAVGITGENMATGDYFVVENKTINGFDLTFKNSSNAAVSRTFDYLAKGF